MHRDIHQKFEQDHPWLMLWMKHHPQIYLVGILLIVLMFCLSSFCNERKNRTVSTQEQNTIKERLTTALPSSVKITQVMEKPCDDCGAEHHNGHYQIGIEFKSARVKKNYSFGRLSKLIQAEFPILKPQDIMLVSVSRQKIIIAFVFSKYLPANKAAIVPAQASSKTISWKDQVRQRRAAVEASITQEIESKKKHDQAHADQLRLRQAVAQKKRDHALVVSLGARHKHNYPLIQKCQLLLELINDHVDKIDSRILKIFEDRSQRLEQLQQQITNPEINPTKLHHRLIDWYRRAEMILQTIDAEIPEEAQLDSRRDSRAVGLG